MSDQSGTPPNSEWSDGDNGSAESNRWSDADWEAVETYVSGNASPDETVAIEHRLQTDAHFAELAAPLLVLRRFPRAVPKHDLTVAWAEIERKATALRAAAASGASPKSSLTLTSSPAARRPQPVVHYTWWQQSAPRWAAAALVLLMFGYATARTIEQPRELASQVYTAQGESQTLTLADGSQVILAPGATLVTDDVVGKATRTVHLEGAGTFIVHADPSHPFIVDARGVSAIAVGTSFHVAVQPPNPGTPTNRPTDIQVGVTSGKVVVQRTTTPGHHETLAILGPGQETVVQSSLRHFRFGWNAAAAHKSVAQFYLESQAMEAAEAKRDSLLRSHGAH